MESCYIEKVGFNRKALTEVYEIIKLYTNTRKERIPKEIRNIIKDNRDFHYEFSIENLEKAELLEETKKILAYLYTEFLSYETERRTLKKIEQTQYENSKAAVVKEKLEPVKRQETVAGNVNMEKNRSNMYKEKVRP